jgi:hypothetical protein
MPARATCRPTHEARSRSPHRRPESRAQLTALPRSVAHSSRRHRPPIRADPAMRPEVFPHRPPAAHGLARNDRLLLGRTARCSSTRNRPPPANAHFCDAHLFGAVIHPDGTGGLTHGCCPPPLSRRTPDHLHPQSIDDVKGGVGAINGGLGIAPVSYVASTLRVRKPRRRARSGGHPAVQLGRLNLVASTLFGSIRAVVLTVQGLHRDPRMGATVLSRWSGRERRRTAAHRRNVATQWPKTAIR